MQAHIMSLHTLWAPWVVSKCQNRFILNVVMLHIKLKRMEYRAQHKHISCPYTHARPLWWCQKVKHVLVLKSRHVAYQIKGYGA